MSREEVDVAHADTAKVIRFVMDVCKKEHTIWALRLLKTEYQKKVYSFPLHLSLKAR